MKKSFLSLVLSATILTTHPLFAMEEEEGALGKGIPFAPKDIQQEIIKKLEVADCFSMKYVSRGFLSVMQDNLPPLTLRMRFSLSRPVLNLEYMGEYDDVTFGLVGSLYFIEEGTETRIDLPDFKITAKATQEAANRNYAPLPRCTDSTLCCVLPFPLAKGSFFAELKQYSGGLNSYFDVSTESNYHVNKFNNESVAEQTKRYTLIKKHVQGWDEEASLIKIEYKNNFRTYISILSDKSDPICISENSTISFLLYGNIRGMRFECPELDYVVWKEEENNSN